MSSTKTEPMIQKKIERHLNSPYDLRSLTQKPKDCPNQKKSLHCSGTVLEGITSSLYSECSLSRTKQKKTKTTKKLPESNRHEVGSDWGGTTPCCGK